MPEQAPSSGRDDQAASGQSVEQGFPWKLYAAELAATALLVTVGLSVVIVDFGPGSPIVALLPDAAARRAITGFLFGATGMLLAVSPLGKESGAHMNPVVTLAFWMLGRLESRHAVGYVLCQLTGALLGALPLLAWGSLGAGVGFGATVPGPAYGPLWALVGEAATTFGLIFGLFTFLQSRRLRRFTPALFPFLYAFMVWIEAPVSGTSTNPARTLGPAVIAGQWSGGWIYWLGPVLGTFIALGLHQWLGEPQRKVEVAKLYHFYHDRYGVFHSKGAAGPGLAALDPSRS